ncbi:MAG: DUF3857 domain-containing protein, partial [Chitinophagaceae bacterium]|nr:DUF3857 domain-containing protein [Chitinophagaceae bacterium]
GYDKFNKVEEVSIKVYNSLGFEVQKYKKKDFEVSSAYDGVSLITDDKVITLTTPAPGYPCSVEIEYELQASSYIDLPDWYVNNKETSTEVFRYIVKVPAEMDIRYRSVNMKLDPVIEASGKQKIYTWEAKNIAVKKLEDYGYEASKYMPRVEVAPNIFEYDGYAGEFRTWRDFGKWCYSLYEQKDAFNERRTAEIKSIVSGLPDAKAKVNALYSYLKKNMRYVSIQLGIGGFKPFAVKFVDEKKYGDCKALTNYMRHLLAVAGIVSYPALINAGYNSCPADRNFPSNVFNHVILCVPDKKDTIWLECTSNNSATGFLGSFTENKNALVLTENGGVFVRTPESNFENSKLFSHTEIRLNEEGGAEVTSTIYSTGNYSEMFYEIDQLNDDRKKEVFVQYLNYRQADQFSFVNKNLDAADSVSLSQLYTKFYDFTAGNKLFLPYRVNPLCDEEVKSTTGRETEYLFRFPYIKRDTTILHLPGRFTIDHIPEAKQLENEFIAYKNEVKPNGKTIQVIGQLILKKNIIPAKEYQNLALLINSINQDQQQKIVIRKPE